MLRSCTFNTLVFSTCIFMWLLLILNVMLLQLPVVTQHQPLTRRWTTRTTVTSPTSFPTAVATLSTIISTPTNTATSITTSSTTSINTIISISTTMSNLRTTKPSNKRKQSTSPSPPRSGLSLAFSRQPRIFSRSRKRQVSVLAHCTCRLSNLEFLFVHNSSILNCNNL